MTTLHKIITGYLLQRRYPIHFYVEFLVYIKYGWQEIFFDTLGITREKLLKVNDYGAIAWPCDFLDIVGIYSRNGQYRVPIVARESLNGLNNFDDNGNKIPYNNGHGVSWGGITGGVSINEYGESTGRSYGTRNDTVATYSIIPKRKEFQMNGYLYGGEAVLEYISDGTEIDNATQVTPYAIATLEAFMTWKHKENGRTYSEQERVRARRLFDFEHKKLRGRLDPTTIPAIRISFSRR